MSALRIPNFSNGHWLHEVSLSGVVDDNKKKSINPFKNNGTSIMVTNLPESIIQEQLLHIVEACTNIKLVKKEGRPSLAMMAFSTKDKAFLAICALRERIIDGQKVKAFVKRSKEEVEQRKVERQQYLERKRKREEWAMRQAEREQRKAQRQTERKVQNKRVEEEPKPMYYLYKYGSEDLFNGVNQDWFCAKCKVLNFHPRASCFKCKQAKP